MYHFFFQLVVYGKIIFQLLIQLSSLLMPLIEIVWAKRKQSLMFVVALSYSQLKIFCFVLQSLLTDEQVVNAPVVILGNKIDLPGAASEEELRYTLGIANLTTGKVMETFQIRLFLNGYHYYIQGVVPRTSINGRPLELFMCSVLRREGYGEAFRWLSQYL